MLNAQANLLLTLLILLLKPNLTPQYNCRKNLIPINAMPDDIPLTIQNYSATAETMQIWPMQKNTCFTETLEIVPLVDQMQ